MSLISSIKNESQNSLTNFAPCVKVGLIYFTKNLAEVTQSNQVSCQLIFNYYFLLSNKLDPKCQIPSGSYMYNESYNCYAWTFLYGNRNSEKFLALEQNSIYNNNNKASFLYQRAVGRNVIFRQMGCAVYPVSLGRKNPNGSKQEGMMDIHRN